MNAAVKLLEQRLAYVESTRREYAQGAEALKNASSRAYCEKQVAALSAEAVDMRAALDVLRQHLDT